MAIEMLKNQALAFAPPAMNCACGTGYCQPYETDDQIVLEGVITPMNGRNILLNGPFDSPLGSNGQDTWWDIDTDWVIFNKILTASDPASSSTAVYQIPLELKAKHIYAITAEVTITGSETVGSGWKITINGDDLIFPDFVHDGDYQASGTGLNRAMTATWMYIPTAITTDNLIITRVNDNGAFTFSFHALSVVEISKPALAGYDLNGNIVFDFPTFSSPNSLTLFIDGQEIDIENPAFSNDLFGGSPFDSNNRAFVDVDQQADLRWFFRMFIGILSSFEALDCMTLSVYDTVLNANLFQNGTFNTDLLYWNTNGSGWTWDSGKARFDSPFPTPVSGQLYQNAFAPYGPVYTLTFDLAILVAGSNLKVSSDNGTGPIVIGTFLDTGSYSIDIDTSGYPDDILEVLTIIFEKADTFSVITVDNVVLQVKNTDKLNESNCIDIKEEQGDCFLLFYGLNADNAFSSNTVDALGYTYDDSGIAHTIRLFAKMKYSGFPENKDIFDFSDNSSVLMFAKSQSEYEINIGDAPYHAHRYVSLLRLHDTFNIDNGDYIPSGDYELKPRKTSDNSQALFLVRDKQGISSNYSCSS